MNLFQKLMQWLPYRPEGYDMHMDLETYQKLEELQKEVGCKNVQHLLANAIGLLEACSTTQKEGGKVVFRFQSGKEEVLDQLPVSVD